jgi:hypothetical protein
LLGFRKIFKKIEERITEEGDKRENNVARLNPRLTNFKKPEVRYKDLKRKSFSGTTKLAVLRRQDHRCISCNKVLNTFDLDHIDGDKTNNSLSNCQALCPNCHAEKTRRV